MGKIIYIDTETTGKNHDFNSIIEIAGIVEIDNKVVEEFNFNCKPFEFKESFDSVAIEMYHKPVEEILKFPNRLETKNKIVEIFDKYIDKFDKFDKFMFAGYKADFDLNFLSTFFLREGDSFLGSYINFYLVVDIQPIIKLFVALNKIDIPDTKLSTVCNHFGVQLIDAHTALADIRATRELTMKVIPHIKWDWIKPQRKSRGK